MSSQAKNLTLWIDDLLNPQRVLEAAGELKSLQLPALNRLLNRADYHTTSARSLESLGSYLFHQPQALPSAVTKAAAQCDLNEQQLEEFWLSVDPVQMVPDRDTLVLIPSSDLGITEEESLALLKSFNTHFAEDGLELHFGSATQWYLSLKQAVDVQSTPLAQAAYQSLNERYPQGNAGNYWRQLMNETQMLFYNHDVNHDRRMQDLPEINSIWVWGEGMLNRDQLVMRPNAAVFSDDAYLQGVARLTDARFAPSVSSFAAWQEQVTVQDQNALATLNLASDYGVALEQMTLQQWLELLARLEEEWFEPMLKALEQKQLNSVLLAMGANKHYLLQPSMLKRFWRFKKSWTALVN